MGVNGTQSLLKILLEEPSENRNLVLDNCYVDAQFEPVSNPELILLIIISQKQLNNIRLDFKKNR